MCVYIKKIFNKFLYILIFLILDVCVLKVWVSNSFFFSKFFSENKLFPPKCPYIHIKKKKKNCE